VQFTSPGERKRAEKVVAYARELEGLRVRAAAAYCIVDRQVRWFSWTSFCRIARPLPVQGWKVHVSCASDEASDMLRLAAGPLLRTGATAFKVPSSLDGVLVINSDLAGQSQTGKVLTVYPASDDELREIVLGLQAAWQSNRGPTILSDISVSSRCRVYLRYGRFYRAPDADIFDALGRPVPVIHGPSGTQPDIRSSNGAQPAWAPAPPIGTASVRYCHPGQYREFSIKGESYLGLQPLNTGRPVDVSLALRQRDFRLVVAKRARRGVMSNVLGGDAVTRLRNEYLVLKTLTAAGVNCPAAIAFEADEDGAIEIQSFIDGVTLSALPPHEAMDHLEALSTALRRLHSVGFVHRDVKLANVLMRGGRVYLIDFELAARVGCSCPIPGGTPGYVAPEGVYAPASASADIYSFGATIVEAATGVSPSNVALADNRGRLIGLLNVLRQRGIGRLVARLTEAEPRRRLTLADAEKTLAHLRSQERVGLKHSPDRRRPSTRLRQFCRFAPIAAGLATRLYALDQPTGRVWRNAHIYSRHICQGLNIGSAGILLGLASLDTALGTALFEDDLYEGARWLANAPPYVAAHGLFTGNAGVALALGVISKRLGRGFFAEAARRRLAVAAGQDGHYDLFSGAAGVLWAGCLLSQIVQSEWPLKLVATQADKILTSAKTIGGVTCWAAPSPVFSASEEVHYGAAHGAAGIAMALAAWSRLTDCTRCGRTSKPC
jgi:serine/threonine protein kinase